MAATPSSALVTSPSEWTLTPIASFSNLRALAWDGNVLYASHGYELLRASVVSGNIDWQVVARFDPPWWRHFTGSMPLTFRLCRDGFHALVVLPSGHMVAAVPNAIVTLRPGETEFRTTHRILRGTRPLHIAMTPSGQLFWGEYFSNPERNEVHIYASGNRGATWSVAYTFPHKAIRHVHNIVYDSWENCLWVLTGDDGTECRIVRASCDFGTVDTVLSGNQQARAVALVPTREALYFSSDTPFEQNYIYRLDRGGNLRRIAAMSSSSISGCAVGKALFFSTMVEPSGVNLQRDVGLYGSQDGEQWQRTLQWKKDAWSMRWFQYGNALLPDGMNTSGVLAVSTVATESGDLGTSLWKIS
jgi:hypothetical protein